MLGSAAFASVIILALSGLLLVGMDTVSSQGKQLVRVVQPRLAQAPEVTTKENSQDKASDKEASGEKSPDNKGSDEKQGGSGEKGSEKKSSDEKDSEEKAKKEESDKPKDEDADPSAPESNRMWMTIPRLGIQGDTVYNSGALATMDVGAIKLPPTGFPWQENANTYITAHRIGYPGTQSYYQFYSLPAMQQGDVVYLTDANGTTYEYRVTEKFAVSPSETWVTKPQPEGDMVTLQTCVVSPHPSDWWEISPALFNLGPDSGRLIVQAEKVETYVPENLRQ